MARPLKNRISRCPIPHNWTYKKTGHVFQGRYKAIIVDKDSYLLELCRYVVLNPVRAHIVEIWKWSSYHVTAGIEKPPAYCAMDQLLGQFSKNKKAQKIYTLFSSKKSLWKKLKGQIFLR